MEGQGQRLIHQPEPLCLNGSLNLNHLEVTSNWYGVSHSRNEAANNQYDATHTQYKVPVGQYYVTQNQYERIDSRQDITHLDRGIHCLSIGRGDRLIIGADKEREHWGNFYLFFAYYGKSFISDNCIGSVGGDDGNFDGFKLHEKCEHVGV